MKKQLCAILALMLCACSQSVSSSDNFSAFEETPVPTETPTPTPEETEETSRKSLHPDEVTDYDRESITSLINEDLVKVYGKGNFTALKDEDVTLTKQDGIITASGVYKVKGNYNNFTYVYEDQNVDYILKDKDIGTTATAEDRKASEQNKKNNKSEAEKNGNTADGATGTPDNQYDVNFANSVTVQIQHSGDGDVTIQLAQDGEIKEVLLSESGDFSESVTSTVEAGSYQLQLFSTGGYYSLSYSTN